jgi:hypothetical protein
MGLPLQRFTIRGLLIAIAVIAGVLAIPDPWRVIACALSIPCLSLLYGRWLYAHGLIGMAVFCFWTSAILINLPMGSRDQFIVNTRERLSTDSLARRLYFLNEIIY